jgi:multiple sugar transport system substrate-binding protein
MFYTGKAAMWSGGSWYYGEAPESMRPDILVGGMPLSSPTAWKKPWILTGDDAKAVWITRNGVKKLDAVKKIIQCIYTPENIGGFVIDAGMPPPLKEVKVDEVKLNPIFKQTLEWGDMYEYISFAQAAAGVDTSQAFRDLWLPTTSAEMIVKEIDQAYMEGLGK